MDCEFPEFTLAAFFQARGYDPKLLRAVLLAYGKATKKPEEWAKAASPEPDPEPYPLLIESTTEKLRHAVIRSGDQPLSPREQQVLTMLREGHSTASIGKALQLSVKTVWTYRARLRDKLDLDGTDALRQFAVSGAREIEDVLSPTVSGRVEERQEWPG